MTRVVHVVCAGEVGGAERMLADLASRPEETGATHAVALFSPRASLATMFRETGLLVHDRGRVSEGPLPFFWRSLSTADVDWLSGILREERAAIVHLHTVGSQVVGTRAALRCGSRVLRTDHSTRAYDDWSVWPFSAWALQRADLCVAVSDHVRSVAVRRAPAAAKKTRVVRSGVDVERYAPRARGPSDLFTFASVGRLEPRKGVDLALAALRATPGARLEIVGDGPCRPALERLAAALGVAGRVTFHGFVHDPRPVLARADAALCSSRAEGLGIALIEAMSMGLPVIGFAVGGVPEAVLHGRTGILARGTDASALAATMNEACASRDRLRLLGEAARARALACFSARSMRQGYASAYAALAGAG